MAQATSLSLSKVTTPAKFGIGALILGLVFAVYWVGFYSDVSSKLQNAKSQQTRLSTDLSTQKREQTLYMQDKEELSALQLRQKDLNRALPADTQAPAFLSALQQVANVSGVDLQAWQPMDEKTQSFYATFPMKLELAGKFHQIAKFAYEAGKVERIINIENLEMSDPKLEGDEVKLKAKCVATTFHAVTPKPAGSAARPGAARTPPPALSAGGPK